MSRRNLPSDPIPEVYKDITLPTPPDPLLTPSDTLLAPSNTQIKTPIATLHGSKNNLKKIKSYNKFRRSTKVSNQKELYMNDMKAILNQVEITTNEERNELLLDIANHANEFFMYGKKKERESTIDEVIELLMVPFFENVTDYKFELYKLRKDIIKQSAFRRGIKRIYNFFCLIGKA
jgi:hypothetical protein